MELRSEVLISSPLLVTNGLCKLLLSLMIASELTLCFWPGCGMRKPFEMALTLRVERT